MSTQNEAIVQRWWQELWNGGDLAVADEIVAPGFTDHDPASPWVPPGIDGCKTLVTGYRTVFPDIHFTIEQQVAAENTVVSHWRCRGTHKGELMGVAPTGKGTTVTGVTIDKINDGKIVESWNNWDTLGLMRQLGVVEELTTA